MAEPVAAPADPQTPAAPPPQAPATSPAPTLDPHARALSPDELTGITAPQPLDAHARPLTPDELDVGLFRAPGSGGGQMPRIDTPPDFVGNTITGLLTLGGMVGAPYLAGGMEAAPFLTRTALRALMAGGGGMTGNTVGRAVMGQPPPTPGQAIDLGLQGAGGEAFAPVIGKGFNLTRNFLAKTPAATPFAARVAATQAERFGGPPLPGVTLSPAQAAPGRLRGFFENIGRLSLFGGGRFEALDANNQRVIAQAADDLVNQYGPKTSPEEAGTAIQVGQAGKVARARGPLDAQTSPMVSPEATGSIVQAAAQKGEDAARDASDALYKEVDRLAGDAKVSLDSVVGAAQRELGAQGPITTAVRGGKSTSTLKTVSAAGEPPPEIPGASSALTALSHLDPNDPRYAALEASLRSAGVTPEDIQAGAITFGQAQRLRSAFGQLSYAASRATTVNGPQDARLFLRLKDAVDTAMTQGAGGAGSPLRQAFDTATAHYRDVVSAYSRGILSQAIEAEPRAVTSTLLQPGRVQEVSDLWQHLNPEAKQAVQGQWLHDVLFHADGTPQDPTTIMRTLQKWDIPTLGAIFDHPTVGQITQLGPQLEAATIGGVARSTPAEAFKTIAAAVGRGDVQEATKLRQLVGPSDWGQVQSAHAQDLLYDSAGKLKTATRLSDALGPKQAPVLEAIYGKDGVEQFREIQRSLAMTQRPGSRGLGLMMRIGQGGAAFELAEGAAQAEPSKITRAGSVLLAPWVVARIMTNPAARSWLTTGLQAHAAGNVTLAARVGGQLAAWLVHQGLTAAQGAVGAPPPPMTPGAGGRAGGPPPAAGGR